MPGEQTCQNRKTTESMTPSGIKPWSTAGRDPSTDSPPVPPQVVHGLTHLFQSNHTPVLRLLSISPTWGELTSARAASFSTKLLLLCVDFVDFLNSNEVLKPGFPVYHYPWEQQHRAHRVHVFLSIDHTDAHPSHSPQPSSVGGSAPSATTAELQDPGPEVAARAG